MVVNKRNSKVTMQRRVHISVQLLWKLPRRPPRMHPSACSPCLLRALCEWLALSQG